MADKFPPLLTKRDKETGLIEGIPYVFNEDGTVNWRKMVEPKYLRVNAENFTRRGQPVPDKIDGLDDNDLIILLAGLKKLAKIRGYEYIQPRIHTATREYVASECHITWLPHRDVYGEVQTTGGQAMAHLGNTDGFTQAYLCEMAQNRAFARCIRDYLGIEIVSKEEVAKIEETGTPTENTTMPTPHELLAKEMERTKRTFEEIKAKLIEKKFKNAETFEKIEDIPTYKALEIKRGLEKCASK